MAKLHFLLKLGYKLEVAVSVWYSAVIPFSFVLFSKHGSRFAAATVNLEFACCIYSAIVMTTLFGLFSKHGSLRVKRKSTFIPTPLIC